MSNKGRFSEVPKDFSFPKMELETLDFWKKSEIYKKSLEKRQGARPFVFYEGPPTANGMPHPGHCLTRTVKDVFPRYKTMDGYYCERKAGWDTHGLPVEIEVCKELGIIDGGKEAIEKYGVAQFNKYCQKSVFRYTKEWEDLTNRLAFWVNTEEAYITYQKEYVQSVWWVLKKFFDEGLLYQGHKVVWWWPQGGTALSAGEVGEGYRETADPAITVRFSLKKESARKLGFDDLSVLAWTTTPWTLSSNCALAVSSRFEYAVAEIPVGDKNFPCLLSKDLLERQWPEAKLLKEIKGKDLLGLSYEPLFAYDTPQTQGDNPPRHWEIIEGDFLSLEKGTGIVHLAPAFGEDDNRACRKNKIGFLCFVRPDGTFDERVTDVDPYDKKPIAGQFCKEADKGIIRILKANDRIVLHDQYVHSYPFCPRAENDPLIQYARKSWFVATQKYKDRFLANNKQIKWQPQHIRDGRFGNFLESNVDWALSRERFWGTPLPIWICEKTGHMEAVGSLEELHAKKDLQGRELWEKAKAEDPELNEHLEIHKPYIDEIHYQSPKDPSSRMRRVPEVIDVWFDAGSMPMAQWGYPHTKGSEEKLQKAFPADFISEAIDQTRGWFNALVIISSLVFEDKEAYPHPFKNCICLGLLLGEDGQKLSKRKKNYKDVNYLFENYGSDALRWSLLASQPPTASVRFTEKNVEEATRDFLIRWQNVLSFFAIYANLDGFVPSKEGSISNFEDISTLPDYPGAASRPELDRWILSELQSCIEGVRENMDGYEPYAATQYLKSFMDSLSNWYVRRSRDRFWAHGWSDDKKAAYWTLYESLVTFAALAAPFTPYFSDYVWQSLVRTSFMSADESVHLANYPKLNEALLHKDLQEEMALVREVVSSGLAARAQAKIKVRQPLQAIEVVVEGSKKKEMLLKHQQIIADELNIKELRFAKDAQSYVDYEILPNYKVLGRKLGKLMKPVKQKLLAANAGQLYKDLKEKSQVEVILDTGESLELGAEELELRLKAKEGFSAEQGRNAVVILSTQITPELREEGLGREFIHLVQNLRKEKSLNYDDRIKLSVEAPSQEIERMLQKMQELIRKEVLALSIEEGVLSGVDAFETQLEGQPLKLYMSRA